MYTHNLKKHLSKLPKHLIIDKIEPYTRTVLAEDLKYDINHYRSIRKLHAIYNFSLMTNLVGNEGIRLKNILTKDTLLIVRMSWFFIEMDILSYLIRTDLVSTLYSRVYNSRGIPYIPRMSFDTTNMDMLISTEFQNVKNHVRRIWALLTATERDIFLRDEVLQ